jgi:uncharacterized iron-regulated protein
MSPEGQDVHACDGRDHVCAARRRLVAGGLCAALAACAGGPPRIAVPQATVVLLGEVHDHPAGHARRLELMRLLLAQGRRPAVIMEQLDASRQRELDRVLATGTADAAAVIAAGGAAGWDWPLYRPYLDLALAHRLPLIGANLSRAAAREIMRDGLAAHGFDDAVPQDLLVAQAQEIEIGHCGKVDANTARAMAMAQVARDQLMARLVESRASGGALLLAGNGHVRTDIGVPRWLSPATRRISEAIGFVEQGDDVTAYDRRIELPARPRSDPCSAFASTSTAYDAFCVDPAVTPGSIGGPLRSRPTGAARRCA